MQIINKTVQCSECGCIAFPDAIYCPKCGTSYRVNKEKREIKDISNINCFSTPVLLNTSKSIMEAYYRLICPHHGQVDIKATIIIPAEKCPLCQGN
jgi:hypothetical protein